MKKHRYIFIQFPRKIPKLFNPINTLISIERLILEPKSFYRSCARIHFYGTENEIWAGFGPIGNTEKKMIWADYEQLLRAKKSFF